MNEITTDNKQDFKKTINRISIGLILYQVILFAYVFFDMIVYLIKTAIVNAENIDTLDIDVVLNEYIEFGTSSIIACILATLFLCHFLRKKINIKKVFESNEKMTIATFLKLLCVFMGAQFVFSLFGEVLDNGLNLIGYSAMEDIESASAISTTISMFLYAGIVGPIIEEVVYRGLVLKSLEKYGKVFAIVVSSIVFGVMHMNLPQSVFAIAVGLVLGFITVNYSIKWSILLHIINNCLFGDILAYAIKGLPESTQSIINYALVISLFVVGVIVLIRSRQKIKNYLELNKTSISTYVRAFLTPGLAIFVVGCTVLAISSLTKI